MKYCLYHVLLTTLFVIERDLTCFYSGITTISFHCLYSLLMVNDQNDHLSLYCVLVTLNLYLSLEVRNVEQEILKIILISFAIGTK